MAHSQAHATSSFLEGMGALFSEPLFFFYLLWSQIITPKELILITGQGSREHASCYTKNLFYNNGPEYMDKQCNVDGAISVYLMRIWSSLMGRKTLTWVHCMDTICIRLLRHGIKYFWNRKYQFGQIHYRFNLIRSEIYTKNCVDWKYKNYGKVRSHQICEMWSKNWGSGEFSTHTANPESTLGDSFSFFFLLIFNFFYPLHLYLPPSIPLLAITNLFSIFMSLIFCFVSFL